ncbi:unnamed protein product, partial [Meganyctiphanes norvegica]
NGKTNDTKHVSVNLLFNKPNQIRMKTVQALWSFNCEPAKEDKGIQDTIIIVVVTSILILIVILVTVILMLRQRRMNRKSDLNKAVAHRQPRIFYDPRQGTVKVERHSEETVAHTQ